jgi:hypothetical protein
MYSFIVWYVLSLQAAVSDRKANRLGGGISKMSSSKEPMYIQDLLRESLGGVQHY